MRGDWAEVSRLAKSKPPFALIPLPPFTLCPLPPFALGLSKGHRLLPFILRQAQDERKMR